MRKMLVLSVAFFLSILFVGCTQTSTTAALLPTTSVAVSSDIASVNPTSSTADVSSTAAVSTASVTSKFKTTRTAVTQTTSVASTVDNAALYKEAVTKMTNQFQPGIDEAKARMDSVVKAYPWFNFEDGAPETQLYK